MVKIRSFTDSLRIRLVENFAGISMISMSFLWEEDFPVWACAWYISSRRISEPVSSWILAKCSNICTCCAWSVKAQSFIKSWKAHRKEKRLNMYLPLKKKGSLGYIKAFFMEECGFAFYVCRLNTFQRKIHYSVCCADLAEGIVWW